MDRIDTLYKAADLFGAGKHGFRDGDLVNAIIATRLDAEWFNAQQEEPLSVIEGAGLVPAAGNYTQLRQAMKRMFGGNVTTVNAANSPLVLTADNAGLVIMDATAGNIVANLPAVNVIAQPLRFNFVRTDATANTATVNCAGANTFVGGTTNFGLIGQADYRVITGDATSKWAHTAYGFGQRWQNLTGSRAVSVTYYNTTGRPIAVNISLDTTYAGTRVFNIDGVQVDRITCASTVNIELWTRSIVPPGAAYSFVGGGFTTWMECR